MIPLEESLIILYKNQSDKQENILHILPLEQFYRNNIRNSIKKMKKSQETVINICYSQKNTIEEQRQRLIYLKIITYKYNRQQNRRNSQNQMIYFFIICKLADITKLVQNQLINMTRLINGQNYYKQLNSITMSSSILFPTNQYTSSSKSYQEIQKLMMPQQSTLDILKLILTKGHPLQQPFAYRNFYLYPHQLLELICSRLPKEDTQNQVLIVESLKKLITVKLQPQQINSIFDCLIQALRNWTTINNQHLIQAIDITFQMSSDKTQMLKNLQKTVLQMGKQSQPIVSRVIAGTLVPVICKHTGKNIKGQMIDIIKRIIADSQVEAKKVWVTQIFPKLLQNLKIQFIQLHLQQKLYETVYDQNVQIGLMALEVILRNTTKFSLEQQGSRIVKLFIDSMTSKNQKIALMATSFMGETFQNLQAIILKSQTHCLKFWKSLIEVAQSKNQKILNNFIFNLPGILHLSKKYHRVDPVCELYAELFYNTDSDTLLLASYFHEMAQMFPSKFDVLKDTVYTLFNEVFQQGQPSDESLKILDSIMANLSKSKQVFFEEQERQRQKNQDGEQEIMKSSNQIKYAYFESAFNDNLYKYLTFSLNKKNGNFIKNIYNSISQCCEHFSPNFTQISLLPKLYSAIRSKSAYLHELIKLIIQFLVRDSSSSSLVNNYVSKINVELSKSTRSHEREAAMLFFYYSSFQFSIDTFQQFKMGQKYLQFNNDKNLKNKLNFIEFLPRLNYFFTRQQKIQSAIILKRFRKDTDPEVLRRVQKTDFNEYQQINKEILMKSKELKQKQKTRGTLGKRFGNSGKRDTIKELKKQQILKKRVETRSKTKMLIKELPKKKTPISFARPSIRKNS